MPMNLRDYAALKTRLLCEGVRIDPELAGGQGRSGGAGPFGQYIAIPGFCGVINVPTYSCEHAAYLLTRDIKKHEPYLLSSEEIVPVIIPRTPVYYDYETSDGVPMKRIALRHGYDVLGSTIYQKCTFVARGQACKFCTVEKSLTNDATTVLKTKQQIKETAKKAWEFGETDHTTFTTGTMANEGAMISRLNDACEAVRDVSGMTTHVQLTPPRDLDLIDDIIADTIGIHLESLDETVLADVCPAKYTIGIDYYFAAIERAVAHVGKNQVSSFILLGLGEDREKTIAGCERLCRIGAIPYIVPFRPLPGAELENWPHPSTEYISEMCETVARIMKDHDIDPEQNQAGCVRCGGCSPIGEFYKLQ